MSSGSTADLFDLTGRRAIVTGGAGLLGRVFARALLDLGAEVHHLDRDEGRLEEVLAALPDDLRRRAVAVRCDLTDEDDVEATVAALARQGRIDILVNSAAIDPKFDGTAAGGAGPDAPDDGHLTRYPVDRWRQSLEVNLTGVFLITRSVCRVMQTQGERGEGTVVNLCSTYGLVGPDQRIYDGAPTPFFKPVDYSVTKAGLLGFTRAVASLYRDSGIRVNALSPGGAFDDHDPAFVAAYSYRTITGRMADPDEYRGAIAFLCSDASSYMTGANLVVDGGWTAL